MANDDPVKADLDSITAMAKRLKLTGAELTKYVHDHMVQLGYKSKRSYYKEVKQEGGRRFWGGKDDDDDDNDDEL